MRGPERFLAVAMTMAASLAVLAAPPATADDPAAPTSAARTAVVPSAVVSLRVVKQRDHRVVLAWRKPVTGNPTGYRIAYAGKVIRVAASARTVSIGGVPNGPLITFAVRATSRSGLGVVRRINATGAGRPNAPDAPTASSADNGTTKFVSLAWEPVSANGPGPVQYRVIRDGAVVVCGWSVSRTCGTTLTNDGTTHLYQVRARNAEETSAREAGTPGFHVSALSAGRSVEAASTPEDVQITSLTATGTNQQVRVAFTTGRSFGSSRVVECTVNGLACPGSPWTYGSDNLSDVRVFSTGVPNGSTAMVQLRLCNGSSGTAQTGASCSSTVGASTTPYGAIPQPSINATANGGNINVSANWGANGKNVNVVIRRNGETIFSQSNVGAGSHSFSDPVGYSQSRSYEIVVTDTALAPGQNAPRSTQGTTAGATTPPPPAASVAVTKGASAIGLPGCSHASCRYIVATTAGFEGTVTCRVSNAYAGIAGFITWTQGPNETKQSPNYYGYPDGWVEVTCGGVTSPRFYW